MTYQDTTEGYVIRISDGAKIAITDTPEYPNTNPDYLAYRAWLDGGGVPDPAPFADHKSQLLRAADQHAAAIRNAIVADISPAEMASWPIKRAEALAYQSSGLEADAPNLGAEAVARDCSLADLVARVLDKSVALSAIEAQIAGHTGKLQDQIRAVDDGDSAALAAIDITAGWPEVSG